MKILGISGSLQAASANSALLDLAGELAGPAHRLELSVSVGEIPHFNPELDVVPPPATVAVLRAQIAAADAVLIAAPEYAHSFPGSLKNALDWIVGSGELYDKPVALLSAAPIEVRGRMSREALEQTLRAQGVKVVASATAVPDTAADTVRAALDALIVAVS